jgi:hypothetical protein
MAAMPSHSPHASHPSTFRAPGWGAPASLSSCCRWRNTTSRKLIPFIECSLSPEDAFVLMACPRPSSGAVGEGLVAAASALRSSLLLFGRPERRSLSLLPERASASHLEVLSPRKPSNVGGCSYLRGRNRSSVCNGTLSAGVCSLWLSRPEHQCILA